MMHEKLVECSLYNVLFFFRKLITDIKILHNSYYEVHLSM